MLNEGLIAKLAVIPAGVYVVAEVVPRIVSNGFGGVAVVAAGCGGLAYFWRLSRRAHANAHALVDRIQNGLSIIEETPGRFDKLEQRADAHDSELQKHSQALDVIADADKYRIKDAVVGDERSPVDRRAA